mmetsp:Transcript_13125/g.42773  ORF Transcript_13125/g.42773 Transcript_13125/m.42773 type:complete len:215 (-) Transcript_13125:141-785(-)
MDRRRAEAEAAPLRAPRRRRSSARGRALRRGRGLHAADQGRRARARLAPRSDAGHLPGRRGGEALARPRRLQGRRLRLPGSPAESRDVSRGSQNESPRLPAERRLRAHETTRQGHRLLQETNHAKVVCANVDRQRPRRRRQTPERRQNEPPAGDDDDGQGQAKRRQSAGLVLADEEETEASSFEKGHYSSSFEKKEESPRSSGVAANYQLLQED